MPPASCWSCCPDGGVAASAHDCASRQVRPVATRDLDCSGAGNHADGVARQYPPNSSSSSPTWRRRIALRTSRLGVLHWNVTVHPTAEWTIQQFRDGLPLDGAYRVLVHDRDGIFAPAVDEAVRSMSLRVLKTPVRAPQANAHCERFIGTARRECLDWMIPLNERHLRRVLAEWIAHYNGERPHSALGPGLPDEPSRLATLTGHLCRRRIASLPCPARWATTRLPA